MKLCRYNFLKFCPNNKSFTSLLAGKAVQLRTPFFWNAAQCHSMFKYAISQKNGVLNTPCFHQDVGHYETTEEVGTTKFLWQQVDY
jgi:hypothetical protein